MIRTSAYLLVLAVVVGTCAAQAQSCDQPADSIIAPDPLAAKEIARARFEAAHRTDVRPVQEARREAAHQCAGSRLREFLAGRGTHPFLQEATTDLLAARLALATDADERAAAVRESFITRLIIEDADDRRFEAGRIPRSEMLEARFARQQSAWQWAQAHAAGSGRLPWVGPRWAYFYAGSEPWEQLPWIHLIDYRDVARAMHDARHRDAQTVFREMAETMRGVQEEHQSAFLCGRGTFEFQLASSERLLASELAVSTAGKDRAAALERYWLRCQQYETVSQARFDGGRISRQELASAIDHRAEAQIAWRRAQQDGSTWSSVTDAQDPLAALSWAKTRRQAATADVAQLAQTRLAAAREGFTDRAAEFTAGRGTFDFLLKAARRLRDAELAVSTTDAARSAVRERYWRQLFAIEAINRARDEAGRIPLKEYNQARAARLEAELQLIDGGMRD